ncbi:SH2 domain-containing protein 5 isoform X1 [Carcharodon carcharias]|uniref:SH2 domain-containing protein 5 isoform X1 n=3 Tax=Carcharodon carcharias TaxID=13397 RepID=UPI001B7DF899|nr:SH2 domain-containing protein 5 isoform X1 [Carcharodon carcharias]
MAKSRSPDKKSRSRTKFVEYVGSFTVEDQDLDEKTWRIHQQLHILKNFRRKMAVILKFSSQGIKMYNENKETLLMAHALRRILYTTCQPADCQFAFVTRNPYRPPCELFCHLFVTTQPNEATILNLQLCRLFQVASCTKYRREQQSSVSATHHPNQETHPVPSSPVPTVSTRCAREHYGEMEVSLNVSALVSFKRPSRQEGIRPSEELDTEETIKSENYGCCTSKTAAPDSTSGFKTQSKELDPFEKSLEDCSFSSLTLVRKKAIRNKGIRSGAYRSSTFKRQFQQALADGYSCSLGDELMESWRTLAPLQHEEVLMDTVWASAGMPRDYATALLKHDVMGAFLLWVNPGPLQCWTLMMRTPFGVINYLICKNDEGKYYLQQLNTLMFSSIKALVDHYTANEDGLFCCLSVSRVNHCYEEQDSTECYGLDPVQIKPEDRQIASD